jgi:alkylation response protein AidB-like acyl-CoA dehydrogenase
MNFDLTAEQNLLKQTVASFVKRESPIARARALREDPVGYGRDTWKRMGELGWLGLVFPEAHGGLGGTMVDLGILLEELGTTLVPEPILSSVVLAGTALSRAGSEAQRTRWLAPMIAGDATLAFAYAERDGRFDPCALATRAERDGAKYKLSGEKIFVLGAHAADALVVSARTAAGPSLFAVERGVPGLDVRAIRIADGRRAGMVVLDGAVGELLGADGGAAELLEEVVLQGAAAACAEAIGVMSATLRLTREHLCTREQFGVKIGSFQALQHRAAEMFVEFELARSMAILACIACSGERGDERAGAVSAAKVQIGESGRFITRQAIQLHGGIGITDEHDIGLYFKRMQVLSTLFGDDEYHVARYASQASFLA